MNGKLLISSFAIAAFVSGCGGSGGGSSNDPSLGLIDDETPAVEIPTAPTDSDDLFLISADDVYEPNPGGLPNNVCSAPFFEAVSGIYEGTVSVFSNDSNCEWNVRAEVVRSYDFAVLLAPRAFCDLSVTYTVEDTGVAPFPLEADDPATLTINEMEVAQDGQIPCFSGEVTGEILATSSEPEVSEFTFPIQDTFFLDTEVFLDAGTGGAALVFPDGEFDGAGGSVRTVEFFFNADGSLTLPAATLIDPVWFTNIEKVGSDLDLEQ